MGDGGGPCWNWTKEGYTTWLLRDVHISDLVTVSQRYLFCCYPQEVSKYVRCYARKFWWHCGARRKRNCILFPDTYLCIAMSLSDLWKWPVIHRRYSKHCSKVTVGTIYMSPTTAFKMYLYFHGHTLRECVRNKASVDWAQVQLWYGSLLCRSTVMTGLGPIVMYISLQSIWTALHSVYSTNARQWC